MPVLTQFFDRFSNATAKDRGHDSTVAPFKFTKDLTMQFLSDKLQFAAENGDLKVEDVNFFELLPPRETKRCVIGKATYPGVSSLGSRATRSFKAWCLAKQEPVFLKDTWRVVKSTSANVQHIATVANYSDITDHRALTGKYGRNLGFSIST